MKSIIITLILFTGLISSQPLFLELNSGVTTPLNYSYVTGWTGANVVVAWICGNNSVVLKTTSSGGSWINVPVPGTINLYTIMSTPNSSLKALATGVRSDTAIVYLTTNAGTNWQVVFRQYQGTINGFHFSGSTVLMVGNPVGSRWSIWKSTNEGLTWDSTGMYLARNGSESGFKNSFNSANNTTCLFGTNNNRIYYTTNTGSTWAFMSVPFEQNIYMVNFPGNLSVGYAAGTSKVYFTTNSGANWDTTLTSPGTGNISGLVACPLPVSGIGWYYNIITKNNGNVYGNPPSSMNWISVYTAPSGNYRFINKHANFTQYSLYAVRDNGGISWGSCGTGGIQRISDIIPMNYSLLQNYPNPFNPVTRIQFDVSKNSLVRISVFDILGKEVVRLADQKFQSGQYEVTWDASEYPSGVYFYSMLTEGYTETKKMILVK